MLGQPLLNLFFFFLFLDLGRFPCKAHQECGGVPPVWIRASLSPADIMSGISGSASIDRLSLHLYNCAMQTARTPATNHNAHPYRPMNYSNFRLTCSLLELQDLEREIRSQVNRMPPVPYSLVPPRNPVYGPVSLFIR